MNSINASSHPQLQIDVIVVVAGYNSLHDTSAYISNPL